jgi:hypothetical protein
MVWKGAEVKINTNKLCDSSLQATTLTERLPLVGEVSANFRNRGSPMVSATNPHGH